MTFSTSKISFASLITSCSYTIDVNFLFICINLIICSFLFFIKNHCCSQLRCYQNIFCRLLKIKFLFDFDIISNDLTPSVSQASLVSFNFSSGLSTLPVKNILPSNTFDLIDNKYFLSINITLADKFFCIIESSTCVPTDLGSNATLTQSQNTLKRPRILLKLNKQKNYK